MNSKHWSRIIGANVRSCRESAGLTQAEVAKRAKCHTPAVSKVESGAHLPSLTTLLRLAEALGVSPCRLLEEPSPS